jgi:thioesterase-3
MSVDIRVRGYHLDIYQHVNNARYLEFLEESRWEYLGRYDYMALCEASGQAFVVVNININYRAPAVMNDLLRVTCRMQDVGEKSARLRQTVHKVIHGKPDQLVADALVTFCQIDTATGTAVAIEGEAKMMLGRMIEAGDL